MLRFKSTLNFVIVFTALLGLVIGCGTSAEKQALTDFLTLYDSTVEEFSAANDNMRAELKVKIDSFKSKWGDMKMELGAEVTPQVLSKLDNEYQKITKKYVSLLGQS